MDALGIAVRFGLYLALLAGFGLAAFGWLSLAGAVAVATLAWGGHGAADESGPGLLHLGADIAHLLAAGVWLGALIGLLLLAARRGFWCDPGLTVG